MLGIALQQHEATERAVASWPSSCGPMDSGSWRPNAGDFAPAVLTSNKVLHLGLTICIYFWELDWEMCELALDAVTPSQC